MSHESTAPADLSNMGIDLSQMFRPSWTLETKESSDTTARLAAKFDEGDRPERSDRNLRRGGGGDRHDRRGGRDARENRGPGAERGGPRPEGRREGQGAQGRGPRREGGRDRHERRGGREERAPRTEPLAKPMLEGWKLQLVPEAAAIEGIARQVRSRAKAYPLFELARLIVQLSDRYSVKLQSEGETSSELYRAKLDGSLWQTRKEASSHLLSKHLEKFYRRSSVTTEPPKGAFNVVAQCGMSGVLLGPPNHHEYTSRLIALHASRFKNMPFELYKSRIRMMRDEALIEQWKTEQSTKTVFNPIEPGSEKEEAATTVTAPEAEIPSSAPAESETDVSLGTPKAEVATEETTIADVETPEAVPEPIAEAASEIAEAESTPAAEEPSPDSPEVVGETSSEAPSEAIATGLSFEEVTAHFNEHHAANEVEPAGGEITLAGAVALHGSTPLLRELLLKNLQEMDRFPLPLAQVLGKELTGRGLQLFKSHKKIINVSVARPRYLDRETTPIGEGFRAIIDYLEAHPKQPRDKQWAALLAQRPDPVAEGTEASAVSEEERIKRREQALATDLLWLLHQGHVIDFAMGNLQAATRPAPKQEPHKKEQKEGVADAATTAPVVEDALAEEVIVTQEAIEAATETPEIVSVPEVTEPVPPASSAPETQEPKFG